MNTSATKLANFRGVLAFAVLSATSAVATTAVAAPATTDGVPSVRVRYDDLNLATDAGTKVLYGRIVKAAQQVCPYVDAREVGLRIEGERCQAEAIAKAVNDVHSTQLAAVHASHVTRG